MRLWLQRLSELEEAYHDHMEVPFINHMAPEHPAWGGSHNRSSLPPLTVYSDYTSLSHSLSLTVAPQ